MTPVVGTEDKTPNIRFIIKNSQTRATMRMAFVLCSHTPHPYTKTATPQKPKEHLIGGRRTQQSSIPQGEEWKHFSYLALYVPFTDCQVPLPVALGISSSGPMRLLVAVCYHPISHFGL